MAKSRLIPLSRVVDKKEYDSVKKAKMNSDERGRALDILMMAQRHYNNMDRFRRERERNKRYTYGDQWKDIVTVDGVTMTEEEYLKKQGNMPLKNNLMRRLVRNVLGVYRAQTKEPTCIARDRDEQQLGEVMSTLLQYNMQLNQMKELYARTMEEFLISGLVVHRKSFGWRGEKRDCWTEVVSPNNFFVDGNMRDFRGWDVSLIGEVHDISFEELCSQFATSPKEFKRLYEIYKTAADHKNITAVYEEFGYEKDAVQSFISPADPSLCRVIEVWRKERREIWRCHDPNNGSVFKCTPKDYQRLVVEENESRMREAMELGMNVDEVPVINAEWAVEDYWYFYCLSPMGDILKEGETPYEHKSHPYVFRMYPFIDGEIHAFANDFIDQQRYTNRLVMMYDWIMRSSSKGVLMFPDSLLPENMRIEDVAEQWTKFDGIIMYSPKPGVPMPQQIASNSTNIGIAELLNLQLKFFEDISGVNGALQGKPGYSGMSGTLYAQQTQNATTSLLDLLESFSMFVIDAAYKDVKNIQQFYDKKKIMDIVGKDAEMNSVSERIADVEFDLSIEESTTTPAYRLFANDMLMQLFQAQAINVEQLLENGHFPFADKLLQSIKAQKEQMENGQNATLPPELLKQAKEGADMNAVNSAYNMMRA